MNKRRLENASMMARIELDRDPSQIRPRLRLASCLFFQFLYAQDGGTRNSGLCASKSGMVDAEMLLREAIDHIYTAISLSSARRDRRNAVRLLSLIRNVAGKQMVLQGRMRARHVLRKLAHALIFWPDEDP